MIRKVLIGLLCLPLLLGSASAVTVTVNAADSDDTGVLPFAAASRLVNEIDFLPAGVARVVTTTGQTSLMSAPFGHALMEIVPQPPDATVTWVSAGQTVTMNFWNHGEKPGEFGERVSKSVTAMQTIFPKDP